MTSGPLRWDERELRFAKRVITYLKKEHAVGRNRLVCIRGAVSGGQTVNGENGSQEPCLDRDAKQTRDPAI